MDIRCVILSLDSQTRSSESGRVRLSGMNLSFLANIVGFTLIIIYIILHALLDLAWHFNLAGWSINLLGRVSELLPKVIVDPAGHKPRLLLSVPFAFIESSSYAKTARIQVAAGSIIEVVEVALLTLAGAPIHCADSVLDALCLSALPLSVTFCRWLRSRTRKESQV